MIPELDRRQHAMALRELWQARVLAGSRGKLAAVVLSMLAHSWPDQIETLCRVVFPGFRGIRQPFFASCGKILKSGEVVADLAINDDITRHALVFSSKRDMEADLRALADRLKLTDKDRTQFFDCARRWIVCDFGRDPVNPERHLHAD